MLISIITAALNSGRTIRACIESVKRQSFRDFEHIVCDGGPATTPFPFSGLTRPATACGGHPGRTPASRTP